MTTLAPLARRLTKLYSDTKKDMLAEQVKLQGVPELNAIHRRFRMQKDRLVAWGLEWSDDSSAASQGSIDESIAKAGLTETVSSVLATIKDILDEAEQIRISEQAASDDIRTFKSRGKASVARDWNPAGKARYEELAKDLSGSIDTLYDLSRSRRKFVQSKNPMAFAQQQSKTYSEFGSAKAPLVDDDLALGDVKVHQPSPRLESLDAGEPIPRIERSDLILPEEEPPPYETIGVPSCTRLIGQLQRYDYKSSETTTQPVLIEYAGFDIAYRTGGGGFGPPLDRLEQVLSMYQQRNAHFEGGTNGPEYGVFKCLGYFEDFSQPRFGLVFELPHFSRGSPGRPLRPADLQSMRPVTLLNVLQASSKSSGAQSQAVPNIPPLEQRFRIAHNLVMTFCRLHKQGVVHKEVNSGNVLLFRRPRSESVRHPDYELRSPFVCSFDIFSETSIDPPFPNVLNIYRHPHDPKSENRTNAPYGIQFDMYGLALILLEIGLWLPLKDVFKVKYSLADFKLRLEDIWIRRLANKCGTVYMNAVRECIAAGDRNISESEVGMVYDGLLSRLQRCCLLDDMEPIDYSISAPSLGDFAVSEKKSPSELRGAPSPFPSKLEKESTQSTQQSEPREKGKIDSPPLDEASAALLKMPELREYLEDAVVCFQSLCRGNRLRASKSDLERSVHLIQRQWRLKQQSRRFSLPRKPLRRRQVPPRIETQISSDLEPNTVEDVSVRHKIKQHNSSKKKKLLVQPCWQPSPTVATEWGHVLLPRLIRICERALKDSDESSSIDLFGIGPSLAEARPTIVITCSSTGKVKAALTKRFNYDKTIYDLKVHKGKIRRSKLSRPDSGFRKKRRPAPATYRSMAHDENGMPAINKLYQQRPVCGASIGAFNGEHMPPVSYGGVVLVDGEPFGMSVHHMLEVPSDDESDDDDAMSDDGAAQVYRSSSRVPSYPWLSSVGSAPALESPPLSPEPFEISDDEDDDEDYLDDSASSAAYESELDYSDYESDTGSTKSSPSEPGDVPGVEAGSAEADGLLITQPAIDDVDEDFFPCEEDKDEDHLDSHELGCVHASSGIRRWIRAGVVHEIDWSLLRLKEERLQPWNLVQGGRRFSRLDNKTGDLRPALLDPVTRSGFGPEEDEFPRAIARTADLASLRVHSFGRTTGLRGGVIGHTMTAVKIHGRRSYSRAWHVTGGLGVGGDSGAWVIDNEHGRVCGHVLAWCGRSRVAYICPMEVLLEDIKRTLGAKQICLPGQEGIDSEDDEEHLLQQSYSVRGSRGFDADVAQRFSGMSVTAADVQVDVAEVRRKILDGRGPVRMQMRGRRGQMA
ncbi:uncharacterized protein IWZ02DRAFT_93454 [Phyllosticta citriasiana]|uniref:uncharacterized protein n=1 Tax=Phyllosticta citriasiana TaxID=595635 RepID=UPI0030FD44FF